MTTKDILEVIALTALLATYVGMKVWAERALRRQTLAHTDPVKFGQRKEASILMRRRVPE